MTDGAKRVAAFCERVITYHKEYLENRIPELDLIADLEECDDEVTREVRESIRGKKIEADKKLLLTRMEIYDLIVASNLPSNLQRIMLWRYHKCWKWSRIINRLHVTKQRVFQLRHKAFELMVPALEKMYPDWQPNK